MLDRSKLRAQLKPAPIAKVAANSTTSARRPGQKQLETQDGKVGYRLFPSHNPEHYFAHIKVVSWLPLDSEDDNGQTVRKRRPVLNSRVHAGTQHDIVEEYMQYCWENRYDIDNFEELDHNALTAKYPVTTGIGPKTSRVAYALQLDLDNKNEKGQPVIVDFGKYEMRPSIWKQINDYITNVDNHSSSLETDPFTDIDKGYYFIVNKRNKQYAVTVKNEAYPIPDDKLEEFMQLDPLNVVLAYKESDWEKQLEGLRNVDEQYGVGVFDSDGFRAIINQVRAQLDAKLSSSTSGQPEVVQKTEETSRPTTTQASKPAVTDDTAELKAVKAEIRAFGTEHPELKDMFKGSRDLDANKLRQLLETAKAKLTAVVTEEEEEDDDEFFDD